MYKTPTKPKTNPLKQKQPTKSPKQDTSKFQPFFPECHKLQQQAAAPLAVRRSLRQPTGAFRTRSVRSDAVTTPLRAAPQHGSGPPPPPRRRARAPARCSSRSLHHQHLLCFAKGGLAKAWRAQWSRTSPGTPEVPRATGSSGPARPRAGLEPSAMTHRSGSSAAAAAVPARLPPPVRTGGYFCQTSGHFYSG